MEKQKLIKLIDVAAGRKKADLVLKNAKIVDVFQAKILTGDIAISDAVSYTHLTLPTIA